MYAAPIARLCAGKYMTLPMNSPDLNGVIKEKDNPVKIICKDAFQFRFTEDDINIFHLYASVIHCSNISKKAIIRSLIPLLYIWFLIDSTSASNEGRANNSCAK